MKYRIEKWKDGKFYVRKPNYIISYLNSSGTESIWHSTHLVKQYCGFNTIDEALKRINLKYSRKKA